MDVMAIEESSIVTELRSAKEGTSRQKIKMPPNIGQDALNTEEIIVSLDAKKYIESRDTGRSFKKTKIFHILRLIGPILLIIVAALAFTFEIMWVKESNKSTSSLKEALLGLSVNSNTTANGTEIVSFTINYNTVDMSDVKMVTIGMSYADSIKSYVPPIIKFVLAFCSAFASYWFFIRIINSLNETDQQSWFQIIINMTKRGLRTSTGDEIDQNSTSEGNDAFKILIERKKARFHNS